MTIGRLLQLVAAGVAASCALASPITFTMTATASGTFAGTSFTGAALTVTSMADTNNIFFANGSYQVLASQSTISIAGFSAATFSDATFWEDPNGAGDILFGDVTRGFGIGNAILGFSKLFAGLETYNLATSFGPLSSPVDFETSVFNNFQNISTSNGSLSLVASNDTFTAVATPEPAPRLILGGGILAWLFLMCRTRYEDGSMNAADAPTHS